MSAEDCILYRKIENQWYVLGYGFTFHHADLDDADFQKLSTPVPLSNLFQLLEALNTAHVTEFGICYAGERISDPPPEVPPQHRMLCCIPDD